MDTKKIERRLQALGLDAWKLFRQDEERVDLYLADEDKVELAAASRRTHVDVTVYKRFGDLLGDSAFTLYNDDDDVETMATDALAICATAKKPSYPLLGKQRYPAVKLVDPAIAKAFADGKAEALLLKTWKKVHDACGKEKGVRLASAELHLSSLAIDVRNSEGLSTKAEGTSLIVELAFTAYTGSGTTRKEQEFLTARTVNRIKDFDAAAFVHGIAASARDVLGAQRYDGAAEGGIALSGEALRDFWAPELGLNPVVFHSLARVKHMGIARFAPGMQATKNKGFTIASDPLIPFNPASNPFDLDGNASSKVTLIEHGACTAYAASQRYAHYLGIPMTGGLGAIAIATGKETAKKLLDGAIQIVAFSSFVPNTISGDFSAEIRLGYLLQGKKRIPIRAAMLSGNVFSMLDGLRPSKERLSMARYEGPAAMRFDSGVTLSRI